MAIVTSRSTPTRRLLITGPSGSGKTDLVHAILRQTDCEAINSDKFYLFRECSVGSLRSILSADLKGKAHLFGVLTATDDVWSVSEFCDHVRDKTHEVLERCQLAIVEGCSYSYNSALASSGEMDLCVAVDLAAVHNMRSLVRSRVQRLLDTGLMEEVRFLNEYFPSEAYPLRKGVFCRNLVPVLNRASSLNVALEAIVEELIDIANSQRVRYRTVPNLRWIENNPGAINRAVEEIMLLVRGW